MIQLSKNEALALADFLEAELVKYIRKETQIDFSMNWLRNMVNVWTKCRGAKDDV